jgi:Leucine-rich repeat (LRR) protein
MIKILFGLAVVLAVIGGIALYNREGTPVDEKTTVVNTVRTTATGTTSENDTNSKPVATSTSARVVIDLSNTGLTKTPMDVFSKTNTEELNLSKNSLTGSLPAEVRLLQNLKVLNLSNNQFTGVPAEIGQLQKLEELDLSNNKITGLPNELGNLTNLKTLNLKGNSYSEADLDGIKARLPQTAVVLVD